MLLNRTALGKAVYQLKNHENGKVKENLWNCFYFMEIWKSSGKISKTQIISLFVIQWKEPFGSHCMFIKSLINSLQIKSHQILSLVSISVFFFFTTLKIFQFFAGFIPDVLFRTLYFRCFIPDVLFRTLYFRSFIQDPLFQMLYSRSFI